MADRQKKLIEEFAKGSVQEKYDALRNLIAKRKHHEASKDKQFLSGVDSLLQTAGDTSAPESERLMSVATLGRLASSVKQLRTTIYRSLESSFAEELPTPSLLTEPDDRSYIGFACEQIKPEWGIDYCAQAAVYEETGEQSRVAFLTALLSMEPDLSSVLEVLGAVFIDFIPSTEDPGTSTAKRIKRLMAALQGAIAKAMPEPGEEPGRKLFHLCQKAFKDVPAPKKEESLYEAADGIASVVHEMVRLRFSLATEATTYSAIKVIKSMLTAHAWEVSAMKSKAMVLVTQDISEAILILAKQGIADVSLAGELTITSGHKKYAKKQMKKLAQTPGISSNVKNWLAEGKNESPEDTKAGESQQLSDDSQLADLLVDSMRFNTLENVGREQILPEIEMLDPRLGEGVARLLQSGMAICDAIQSMARRRRLQMRGKPGDEEEYAPIEHEVIGDNIGVRRVRIIRPVVEQVRENGVSFVISKGVVEKSK